MPLEKLKHGGMTALLLAALCAAPLLGQAGDFPARFNGLQPGAELRVSVRGAGPYRGQFESVSEDALVIAESDANRTIARQDVQKVEVRAPGNRLRHIALGAGIGAVGGLGIDLAACPNSRRILCDTTPVSKGRWVATALGTIVGALVGALLPSHAWRQLYRAP